MGGRGRDCGGGELESDGAKSAWGDMVQLHVREVRYICCGNDERTACQIA